jgi:hypothetical protein
MYPTFTAALFFHRRSGSSRTKILAGRSNCSKSGSPDPRLPASRIGNAPNVANWWKANSLSAGTAALPSPAERQEMNIKLPAITNSNGAGGFQAGKSQPEELLFERCADGGPDL